MWKVWRAPAIPSPCWLSRQLDGQLQFDVGTYMEYATSEEFRVPYLSNVNANALGIIYGDEADSMYYFGGNPLVPTRSICLSGTLSTATGRQVWQVDLLGDSKCRRLVLP